MMDKQRTFELCEMIDNLFFSEEVPTEEGFNVLASWIIGTTLAAVADWPQRRPEDDVYKLLDEIKRMISSQVETARAEGKKNNN